VKALRLEGVKRVLCLGAHCDDIEMGCGAALLRLLSENPGMRVHWAIFVSNAKRAGEVRESAAQFLRDAGEHEIEVFDFRDGFLPFAGAEAKERMQAVKAKVDPDLVFTHYRNDLHQDHRLIAELTWNAFRDHMILEYEVPKWDGDLGAPNFYAPAPAELCERKVNIITQCYASQREKDWFSPDTLLALMRLRGVECRAPSGYAEAFYARKASF